MKIDKPLVIILIKTEKQKKQKAEGLVKVGSKLQYPNAAES